MRFLCLVNVASGRGAPERSVAPRAVRAVRRREGLELEGSMSLSLSLLTGEGVYSVGGAVWAR